MNRINTSDIYTARKFHVLTSILQVLDYKTFHLMMKVKIYLKFIVISYHNPLLLNDCWPTDENNGLQQWNYRSEVRMYSQHLERSRLSEYSSQIKKYKTPQQICLSVSDLSVSTQYAHFLILTHSLPAI